jgi:hypothetical protein
VTFPIPETISTSILILGKKIFFFSNFPHTFHPSRKCRFYPHFSWNEFITKPSVKIFFFFWIEIFFFFPTSTGSMNHSILLALAFAFVSVFIVFFFSGPFARLDFEKNKGSQVAYPPLLTKPIS